MSLDADSGSHWQQAKAGEPTSDVTQDETIVNAVLQLQLFCQVHAAEARRCRDHGHL